MLAKTANAEHLARFLPQLRCPSERLAPLLGVRGPLELKGLQLAAESNVLFEEFLPAADDLCEGGRQATSGRHDAKLSEGLPWILAASIYAV